MRHYVSTYLTEEMTTDERETFFKFMGHSREISKNIYSCRPILKTMSLLSRIHKSLDLQCSTSQSGTSAGESVVCPSSSFQCISPPAREVKTSRKRPLTLDSDSDEVDSSVKSPQAKRTKWNHEDNQKLNQYFNRYVTPNGKKCSPTSDEIEQFLSKYSCSKTFGSSVSFSHAKNLICRKLHNNRRLLCETRKSSTSFKR